MNQRDEGVTVARPDNHREGGGSIPASSLFFQVGRVDEVTALVLRYHYSHRWPSNIQFVGSLHEHGGLFGDSGKAICGLCISVPATRWSEPVFELSRLVRRQDSPGVPLSMLVRLSLSRFRASGGDLVVSFADRTQGHHGGVYQACGWNYGGCRNRAMDGLTIDGRFCPGRVCNHRFGTRSPEKVKAILPHCTVEPHYDEGKHLYWKALTKAGAEKAVRLALGVLDYVKP